MTYVWFDALPNYWTATRVPGSGAQWPAQLHVIGEDITRFHTVIWPAMLMAAGLPLPERVWGHGLISLGGERIPPPVANPPEGAPRNWLIPTNCPRL